MSISIIIPVYNEEECISQCIRESEKAFANTDYEIIVVNDGSTDQSKSIILSQQKKNPRIKLVSYSANKGYSHAIRQGIAHTQKEYSSYLDADLQYPPKELRNMYDFASSQNAAFVLGQPTHKYYTMRRRLISFVYNKLVAWLLNVHVTDANSLKLIKSKLFQELNLKREFGAIELEILVELANKKIPIQYFPIRVQARVAGKSKFGAQLVFTSLKDILALRKERKP